MNPYAVLSPSRSAQAPSDASPSPELGFDELVASATYRLVLVADRWIERLRAA